jgi:hypothetical protein
VRLVFYSFDPSAMAAARIESQKTAWAAMFRRESI